MSLPLYVKTCCRKGVHRLTSQRVSSMSKPQPWASRPRPRPRLGGARVPALTRKITPSRLLDAKLTSRDASLASLQTTRLGLGRNLACGRGHTSGTGWKGFQAPLFIPRSSQPECESLKQSFRLGLGVKTSIREAQAPGLIVSSSGWRGRHEFIFRDGVTLGLKELR